MIFLRAKSITGLSIDACPICVNVFRILALFFLIYLYPNTFAFGRTITYFYAIDEDWKGFCEALNASPIPWQWGGRTIFEAKVGGNTILGVKMESGCVESAISAQAALTFRRVDLAVSVGPVGSFMEDLGVGEWTVVGKVIPWQKSSLQGAEPEGFPSIEFEQMPVTFTGFEKLRRISVASGEQFVSSIELRDLIAAATACDAIDMNLFGIASVLALHRVPSFHLRVVSDHADEEAAKNFRDFVDSYEGQGGRLIAEMIRSLPPDKTQPSQYPRLKELLEPTDQH